MSRAAALLVVLLSVGLPAGGYAEDAVERKVIIVAPEADDPRIAHAREAIVFWNQTLEEMGVRSRLRETEVVVVPVEVNRVLENYARQISLRAGRLGPKDFTPTVPARLRDYAADVVVLLSRQPLMSFAWPFDGANRYLVAIRRESLSSVDTPHLWRNVIAHELGHSLGLTHNRNPMTLMCGGCRLLAETEEPAFRPLTNVDRERLVQQHGTR
jgi:hypothetical protein